MPRNPEMGSREPGSKSQEKLSPDFINRVKVAFPDYEDLHKALDEENEYSIGRALDDGRKLEMSPEDKDGKQDEVLQSAQKADAIEKLYGEFSGQEQGEE